MPGPYGADLRRAVARGAYGARVELDVTGEVFTWRGPAPFYFLGVGEDEADRIEEVARAVTYGWGMVPVRARLGATTWTTSLWPKDGAYVLPLKAGVRRAEGVAEGDRVTARIAVLGL
jgi:hypothetical protein